MITEERIAKLELWVEKELAEIKSEIANQNQPKFKKGDFVFCSDENNINECIVIIDNIDMSDRNGIKCLVCLNAISGTFLLNYSISRYWKVIRLATEAEKQRLINELHKVGKDWDAEKLGIVDYRWTPKLEERYFVPDVFSVGLVEDYCNTDTPFDRRVIELSLAFRTPEEAVAVAKEWLQSRK